MKRALIFFVLLLMASGVAAAEVRIAVASNFAEAIKQLATGFEKSTGHKVKLSMGSTGKHYAQILHGAPFDLFFAADAKRPELLEAEGRIQPGSRFTYAVGRLVLWSPRSDFVDDELNVLTGGDFRYLAVANPKLAPYGKAAQQVLQKKGLWKSLRRKMVRGENIGQAYQYVLSGNAQLGFVALAQVKRPGQSIAGSYWVVPESFYSPIVQQAVRLSENPVAKAFLDYVKSDAGQSVILNHGYDVPR